MKLTDPWFEAEFIGRVDPATGSHARQGGQIDGAQGLFLYAPCHYGETAGAHGLIVLFANPQGAAVVPAGDHYPTPRWTMSGAGLDDLSLSPSIDCTVDPPEHAEARRAMGLLPGECAPGRRCWHGFITNGEVR